MDDSESKRCSRCQEVKPLSDFYRETRRRDGHTAYCRDCSKKAAKKWRDANPESTGRHPRRCSHCGEAKPLEDFYRAKNGPEGRQRWCKDCSRRQLREWLDKGYKENPSARRRERARKQRDGTKRCSNCGEMKSLESFHSGRSSWCKDCKISKNGEYGRRSRARYPERGIARAMKRRTLTFSVPLETTEYIAILRGDPCSYCGQDAGVVDHIDALHVGGDHSWTNLTATCQSCNSSKRTEALLSFLLRRRQG